MEPPLRASLEWRDSERDLATDVHTLLGNDERRVQFLLHFVRRMSEDNARLQRPNSIGKLPIIRIDHARWKRPKDE